MNESSHPRPCTRPDGGKRPDPVFAALFNMLPPTGIEFPPELQQRWLRAFEAVADFIWAPDGTRRAKTWTAAEIDRERAAGQATKAGRDG